MLRLNRRRKAYSARRMGGICIAALKQCCCATRRRRGRVLLVSWTRDARHHCECGPAYLSLCACACACACAYSRAFALARSHSQSHSLSIALPAGHALTVSHCSAQKNVLAMDRRALLFPIGLVLAAAYLSTATPVEHSFALDKPLHTAAVVLLLAGLLIAATEASTARLCPPPPSRHPPPYVAIPLRPARTHTTHAPLPADELWSDPAYVARRRPSTPRAVAALLAVLLLALCARLGLFYRVTKDVECSAPSALAFVPLVLALAHSVRHPSQRQYPAWTADTRPRTLSDRVIFFFHSPSTRYIAPALLLSISSFLVAVKTSSLHSTYICPVADPTAATIPSLQFVGFLLDCLIAQLLYRLVDDAISPADEWTIQLQHGTSNNLLVGLTFIVCSSLHVLRFSTAHTSRLHLWFSLLPVPSCTQPYPSTANGCSLFLLNIYLDFCACR
jgi:hypothetical protein